MAAPATNYIVAAGASFSRQLFYSILKPEGQGQRWLCLFLARHMLGVPSTGITIATMKLEKIKTPRSYHMQGINIIGIAIHQNHL